MIEINIPGFRDLRLAHLVLDYNGTLALDGRLLPGVAEALTFLAPQINIHIITADTFGLATAQLQGLPVTLNIVPVESQAQTKLAYITSLGGENVVAIGNGRNDQKMIEAAALGIALIQREGGSIETFTKADIALTSILDALDLLKNQKRLIATLRC
jgi:soluble P-type ATPase